jgi:DNA-binding NarL/FixJ family response regulator
MVVERQARTQLQRIGLLLPNDFLRSGVTSALRGVRTVSSVAAIPSAGAIPDVDVVIVSSSGPEWKALTTRPGRRFKILMIVESLPQLEWSTMAAAPVDGFVLKTELGTGILADALDRMAAGELPLPADLARQLMTNAGAPDRAPRPVPLTHREQETLELLAEGLSNKQIARRLRISDHGAKRLVASVLLKLGSPNRTTAVVRAIKSGLIDCA